MEGVKDVIRLGSELARLKLPPAVYFKQGRRFFKDYGGFVSEISREEFFGHLKKCSEMITFWRSHPGGEVAA